MNEKILMKYLNIPYFNALYTVLDVLFEIILLAFINSSLSYSYSRLYIYTT